MSDKCVVISPQSYITYDALSSYGIHNGPAVLLSLIVITDLSQSGSTVAQYLCPASVYLTSPAGNMRATSVVVDLSARQGPVTFSLKGYRLW